MIRSPKPKSGGYPGGAVGLAGVLWVMPKVLVEREIGSEVELGRVKV